ncbi:MAG: ATPase, partial [Deltaproteobacteria bacterium]|nr:ATPase [Deltaproteobacteria bacterium]
GIYNHIPGDGREYVVSNPNSVKIRAEDGRSVQSVDISTFISNLPFNKDTVSFSTEDASGSTSQAVNILEAVEVGADVLLIDEDTSATNFMIRDYRMQDLVSIENEPITPFIDKARHLFNEYMVSTILVIGDSGDYFDIADFVIRMTDYRAEDVTLEAKEIVQHNSTGRTVESDGYFGTVRERIPLPQSLDASKGNRNIKISNRGIHTIIFGIHDIDLIALEQLVATSQTNAIGDAIQYAKKYMNGKKSLRQITSLVMLDIGRAGLDVLDPRLSGDYAEFRKIELAAAINRLRTLKVEQKI